VLAMAASPSRTYSGVIGPEDTLQGLYRGGAAKSTRGRVRSPIHCNGYYVLGDFHKSHLFLFRIVIWGLAGPLQRFNFSTP
jgi:hypothetical protein